MSESEFQKCKGRKSLKAHSHCDNIWTLCNDIKCFLPIVIVDYEVIIYLYTKVITANVHLSDGFKMFGFPMSSSFPVFVFYLVAAS